MISKVVRGGGFGGLLTYLFQEEKEAEILAGNMAGQDARDLGSEFGHSRSLRPEVERPVFHASIAAPDNEPLTEAQWTQLADRYVRDMGYADSNWVAIRHHDQKHDHIHIVASRIRHDGKMVNDSWDRIRSQKSLRGIEKELGLQQVRSSWEIDGEKTLSKTAAEKFARSGQLPSRDELRILVDAAAKDKPTMKTFVTRLRKAGIDVRLNRQSTGRIAGISYRVRDAALKGSSLGKAYTWNGLQKLKGVRYKESRDLAAVVASDHRNRPGMITELAQLELRQRALGKELGALPHHGQVEALAVAVRGADPMLEARRHLAKIYRAPEDARRALAAAMHQDLPQAIATLRDTPERFGDLRGRGAGLLRSARHGQARAAAGQAATAISAAEARRTELTAALATAKAGHAELANIAARMPPLRHGIPVREIKDIAGFAARHLKRQGLELARGASGIPLIASYSSPVAIAFTVGRVAVKLAQGKESERARGR